MNRRTFFATVLAPLIAKPMRPACSTVPFTFAEIEAAYLTAWRGTCSPDVVLVWPSGLRTYHDA